MKARGFEDIEIVERIPGHPNVLAHKRVTKKGLHLPLMVIWTFYLHKIIINGYILHLAVILRMVKFTEEVP